MVLRRIGAHVTLQLEAMLVGDALQHLNKRASRPALRARLELQDGRRPVEPCDPGERAAIFPETPLVLAATIEVGSIGFLRGRFPFPLSRRRHAGSYLPSATTIATTATIAISQPTIGARGRSCQQRT
jgi:hypothetical protein